MPFLAVLLAAAAALLLAAAAYASLPGIGRARWRPAACRALALFALFLLLADPLLPGGRPPRPLVLLDASLSLDAAGGRWAAARESALARGEIRLVGDASPWVDTAPSRGASRLGPALRAAAASDRPLVVVTDGEVEDAGDLDPAMLRRAAIVLLPREPVADAALAAVEAPERAAIGDTLTFAAEVTVHAGPGGALPADTVTLELTAAGRTLVRRPLGTLPAGGRRVSLRLPAAALGPGLHAVRVAIVPSDAEPRNDARLRLVMVTASPGAVLIARPGDWDARFLYRTLRDVADIPMRGFVHLGPGGWRRMEDLRPASESEVARAAAAADLLVLKGRAGGYAADSRARGILRWPSGEEGGPVLAGDWYLGEVGASPVGGALAVPLESLPPLARVVDGAAPPDGWSAATAQAGRRGTPRPVVTGRSDGRRREVRFGADGLWRWAFRGGLAEQAYRSLVASTASWLLAAPDSAGGRVRPVRAVVPRGHPTRFAWTGDSTATDTPVTLEGDSGARTDTLRFDGAGRAELWLDPGVWSYQVAGGGRGTVAVEEFSEEWAPRAVTLAAHPGAGPPAGRQAPLRTQWWPYLLAVLALGGEWWWRRRLGLR
ncbi:MAG TPA: hypothetical protein VLA95_01165 [Gemmatimonadales bacterium]|nr:hypothetical protein [Gemmatimonadales bacterium]